MWLDNSKILKRICNLINKEELPKSAYPQLFYIGHKLRKIISTPFKDSKFRCVTCKQEWKGHLKHQCEYENSEYYLINQSKLAEWECEFCEYIWQSEIGYICPKCEKQCTKS